MDEVNGNDVRAAWTLYKERNGLTWISSAVEVLLFSAFSQGARYGYDRCANEIISGMSKTMEATRKELL